MSELPKVLEEIAQGKVASAYLVAGEEFLVRKSAEELVDALVPDRGLNLSVLDGASPKEIASDLATFPLFPGRKVVLSRDPEFLAPKKGRTTGLNKALDAWRSGKRKEAARRVLALVARAGWGVAELDPGASGAPDAEAWREELGVELAEADCAFLREVADFCRDEHISAPESDVGPLVELLEGGKADGQILVLAASEVDSKNPLAKWIKAHGKVIERKVPMGARKSDGIQIDEIADEILSPLGKRLDHRAAAALKDRVGGNMRLLSSELEKLACYADGKTISEADVVTLVARARDEEFMELASAIQDRNLGAALRYVEEALIQKTSGLALLGAIASIVRNLLDNRERLTHMLHGAAPRSMPAFSERVFPKIAEEMTARGQKVPHPYAAFKGMQAAERFRREELVAALCACAEADLALKTSASERLTLERLLWNVCRWHP